MTREAKVRFDLKIIAYWIIGGAIIGGIFWMLGLVTGGAQYFQEHGFISTFLLAPLGGALVWTTWGGIGFIFDAAVNYGWKFGQVEHHLWVWYLYPLIAMFLISFSFVLGIIRSAMRR